MERAVDLDPKVHLVLIPFETLHSIYIAPASGPSGLTTTGFESRITDLYHGKKLSGTKWLVGSSTGALRFMALVGSLVSRERNLTEELMEHYCKMWYKHGVGVA